MAAAFSRSFSPGVRHKAHKSAPAGARPHPRRGDPGRPKPRKARDGQGEPGAATQRATKPRSGAAAPAADGRRRASKGAPTGHPQTSGSAARRQGRRAERRTGGSPEPARGASPAADRAPARTRAAGKSAAGTRGDEGAYLFAGQYCPAHDGGTASPTILSSRPLGGNGGRPTEPAAADAANGKAGGGCILCRR